MVFPGEQNCLEAGCSHSCSFSSDVTDVGSSENVPVLHLITAVLNASSGTTGLLWMGGEQDKKVTESQPSPA